MSMAWRHVCFFMVKKRVVIVVPLDIQNLEGRTTEWYIWRIMFKNNEEWRILKIASFIYFGALRKEKLF